VALVNTLGSFSGGDLAGRLGVPAVWAVHESFTMPMFWHTAFPPNVLDPYVRARGEQAFRNSAAVVFEADATRRLFLANAEPERFVTLPYGMEFDAIDAARASLDRAETRRRLGIEPDAQVVLCLGSIEPRKSQAMLAAAFAKVAQRHPRAQLLLVGETADAYCAGYREALHEYIQRAGLDSRALVAPTTKDPYSWHAVADLLVCASDIESLPRVIIEAMAFGTPVLSTRVFGVPELIEDGQTGYLCEMRDVSALAAGLDRALSATPAERGAIAARASEHVRKRHDADTYTSRIATLLRGLVADPEAVPAELLADAADLGARS
jgi:glycosyltransferase involved in cell wall biosynthesis